MAVLGTQVIKSIQRGNDDLSGGGTTSVTINAVDLSKSFSNIKTANGAQGGKANSTTPSQDSVSYGAAIVAGGNLDSTTALLVRAGSGLGSSSVVASTCRVYWEVIEYV